jgi:predicted esterase
MANNIIGNIPNVGIAKATSTFTAMGLNTSNMYIVYEVRSPLYSWNPDRAINAINGIVAGRGYYIIPKIDMDLTTYFAPPLTSAGGGCGPSVFAGTDQDLPANTGTTTLTGTTTASEGETVVGTRWVVLDYPSFFGPPTIVSPNSLTTLVTGLKSGTYVIQLQSTSSSGAIGVDSVQVIVAEPDEIQVYAGEAQELDEGSTTTNLYGTVTASGDVTIESVEWSIVTPGIVGVTFTRPDELETGVRGMPYPGTIVFRLTATDQLGRTFYGDVSVTVLTPSQMFITTGWDNTRPTQGMYVYLPQGYRSDKAGGYPFILFLHGMGENGDTTTPQDDITALLNETAGMPYFLSNKLYPMKSVVLAPQLHTGVWSATEAQKAVNYALANYNLDLNTVGVTGLSSGGKGAFDITLANTSLFSASMPCNPIYSDVGTGQGATVKDIAFMVVTSYGDETGAPPNAPGGAFAAIDSICSAVPKGLYPPRVICRWDSGHDPETWNWDAYDKRRAVFDFENDFFLLHNKIYATTVTNYVAKAEQSKIFYDWSLAAVQLDSMAASSAKTALQNRMTALLNTITTAKGHRYTMLNLGSNATCPYYAISNAPSCTAGATVSTMYDIKNALTPYSFKVVANTATTPGTDAISHNEMGLHYSMFSTYFQVGGSTWELSGLDTSKVYDFYVYCSDRSQDLKSSGIRTGCEISFNDEWTQLNFEGWNTMFTAKAYSIQPDVTGKITITANPMYAGKGVINSILIRERDAIDNRPHIGRFNFAQNSSGVDGTEYATITTDPTLGPAIATDPKSGWQIQTVGTSSPYWAKYGGAYWADNSVVVGAFTPMKGLPEVVARSGWFNDNMYFNRATLNYNIQCVGVPGMGLPAGFYSVKMYAATTNTEGTTAEYTCKFTQGGVQQLRLNSRNNLSGKYISFTGRMKEGDFQFYGLYMPNVYGQSFLNYLEIERVEE